MGEALHLVRFRLDRRGLARALADQPWFGQAADLGQEVHAATRALFQDQAPRPFHIDKARPDGTVDVLAYSRTPGAALRDAARQFADPVWDATMLWDHFASKEMPTTWTTGTRVGFHVHACPVVRNQSGERQARREEDVYLARKRQEPGLQREEAYTDWLCAELRRRGGTEIEAVRVAAHRRISVVRRTQRSSVSNRRHRMMERPVASFEGVLIITDSDAFQAALARGLGRHRAFGFGMLLLRPPRC